MNRSLMLIDLSFELGKKSKRRNMQKKKVIKKGIKTVKKIDICLLVVCVFVALFDTDVDLMKLRAGWM